MRFLLITFAVCCFMCAAVLSGFWLLELMLGVAG